MTGQMVDETYATEQLAETRITIANRLQEIATVTDALETFAHANGVSDEIVWRFHLALEELIRNVITHAYPDKEVHQIQVRFECGETWMAATVSDDGVPFNPLNAQAPDLSRALEDREIGGLGIHLARNVIDRVGYAWEAGRNVVTLQSPLTGYRRSPR